MIYSDDDPEEQFERFLWRLGIGVLALLTGIAAAVILSGCTTATFGEDVLASAGTDAEAVFYQGGAEPVYVVLGQNQSRSFREPWKSIRWLKGLDVIDSLGNAAAGVIRNRDTVGATTEQLGINRAADSADLQTTTAAGLEGQRIGLEPDLSP